jgi:hypothetical protein
MEESNNISPFSLDLDHKLLYNVYNVRLNRVLQGARCYNWKEDVLCDR